MTTFSRASTTRLLATVLIASFSVACGEETRESLAQPDVGSPPITPQADAAPPVTFIAVPKEAGTDLSYSGPPQATTLAEANATLEALREKYHPNNLPDRLLPHFTNSSLRDYIHAFTAFSASLPLDVAWVSDLDAATLSDAKEYNRAVTQSRRKSLLRSLEIAVPKALGRSIKTTKFNLYKALDDQSRLVQEAAESDLSDHRLRNKLFSRPNDVYDVYFAVAESPKLARLAELFESQIGQSTRDWTDHIKQIQTWQAEFDHKIHNGAEFILPPRKVDDATLLAVAQDVLTREEYKVGEWERLLVNTSAKTRRSMAFAIASPEIKRHERVWKEFQATTIQRDVDGNLYIFYHHIVKYTTDLPNDVSDKWVLDKRFRGPRILPENNIN